VVEVEVASVFEQAITTVMAKAMAVMPSNKVFFMKFSLNFFNELSKTNTRKLSV
jgi:hypothetical protein